MRKRLAFLLTLCAALLCMALAEETTQLTVLPVTETVRPGKGVTLAYEAPEAGEACIQLVDDAGNTVLMIDPDRASTAGTNELIWNGTYEGVPAPEGTFHLTVRLGEETSSVPIHIGPYAPYMNHLRMENGDVTPETPLRVSCTASQRGALNWSVCDSAMKIAYPLDGIAVEAGPCELTWDGTLSDGSTLPDGAYIFTLLLIDETGFESNEERLPVTVAGFAQSPPMEMPAPTATPAPTDTPQPTATDTPTPTDTPQPAAEARSFTPSYRSTDTSDTSLNYWTLPMDITDEAAVWEVLMQPITVVDGHQQAFIYVRSEPSDDAEAVGEITCASQGVHVLETLDNGWSRIEAYSSSFADSKVKAYAKFISGYVPTKKLKQITPSQEYGLVVDKLTQRLYLFKEGKLYSTMLCSTGLVNKDQPWNETMSGEYLIVSASGGFMSGNMHCAMGRRQDARGALYSQQGRQQELRLYRAGLGQAGQPRMSPRPAQAHAGGRQHGVAVEQPGEEREAADLGGLARTADPHSCGRFSAVLQPQWRRELSQSGDVLQHQKQQERDDASLHLRGIGAGALCVPEALRILCARPAPCGIREDQRPISGLGGLGRGNKL